MTQPTVPDIASGDNFSVLLCFQPYSPTHHSRCPRLGRVPIQQFAPPESKGPHSYRKACASAPVHPHSPYPDPGMRRLKMGSNTRPLPHSPFRLQSASIPFSSLPGAGLSPSTLSQFSPASYVAYKMMTFGRARLDGVFDVVGAPCAHLSALPYAHPCITLHQKLRAAIVSTLVQWPEGAQPCPPTEMLATHHSCQYQRCFPTIGLMHVAPRHSIKKWQSDLERGFSENIT
jgi:hypothetical protein